MKNFSVDVLKGLKFIEEDIYEGKSIGYYELKFPFDTIPEQFGIDGKVCLRFFNTDARTLQFNSIFKRCNDDKLFTCPFHCEGCYNSSIWDFRAGHEYNDRLEAQIMADLSLPYVQGITFLGGEPLLNTGVLLPLSRKIRERFGRTKDIWCWTGYTWEELMREGESPDKRELLEQIDILVDGRYIKDLHDSLLQFRGSSNQRIIDVPKSLESGQVVLWSKLHDQTRFIPEIYGKDRVAGEGAAS